MKIVVIGAGAMGCLYGGKLALAGNEVALIGVRQEVIDSINHRGLIVENEHGKETVKALACTAGQMKDTAELIILLTKTLSSRSALESAKHMIGENTLMLTLQNGFGNLEMLQEYTKPENILVGVSGFPSDVIEPGWVKTTEGGSTKLMSADPSRRENAELVQGVLNKAGLNAQVPKDVLIDIWEKAAFNIAVNSVTAICRISSGILSDTQEGRVLVDQVIDEVCEVAYLYGKVLSKNKINDYVNACYTAHRDHYSSMTQDVLAKRKTEIEALNGAVIKKARAKGMAVPHIESLYALMKIIENSYKS